MRDIISLLTSQIIQAFEDRKYFSMAFLVGLCFSAILLYLYFDAADSDDNIIRYQNPSLIILLVCLFFINLFILWIASDPKQRLVEPLKNREPKFNRKSIILSKRIKYPLLFISSVTIFIAIWISIPRVYCFSNNESSVRILVARFWTPGSQGHDNPEGEKAQHAILAALEDASAKDKELNTHLVCAPLDRVFSTKDIAKSKKAIRWLAKKSRADFVVWGEVLSAENKIYRLRCTLKEGPRKVLFVEKQVQSVVIDRNPCPPELSESPMLLARCSLGLYYSESGKTNQAIALLKHVLQELSKKSPQSEFDVAQVLLMIADSYLYSFYEGNHQDIYQAIDNYQRALEYLTEGNCPLGWATTNQNMGVAYVQLYYLLGEDIEYINKAIECFNNALRVFTKENYLENYAMNLSNLGVTYARLPTASVDAKLSREKQITSKKYSRSTQTRLAWILLGLMTQSPLMKLIYLKQ